MAVDLHSPLGRAVQRVAGSAPFAAVAPKVVPRLDRLVNRLTGGRVIISQALLPSLMLTTTGRVTGRPRTVPLATMPVDSGFLVVGSNFGKPAHPAWSTNLLHQPEAQITYRGRTLPVRAHLLSDDEKRAAWPRLTTFWP